MTNAICPTTDLHVEECDCVRHRADAPPVLVPELPGLYDDIPDEVYHGDRSSLSSSGARTLLKPGGPAIFQHQLTHVRRAKHYDEGHIAHALLLGTGLDIREVKAKDWRTNAAKAERDAAYAAGQVPVLSAQLSEIREMVAVARANDVVAELLAAGRPEVSAWAIDAATWAMLRARFDWLRDEGEDLVLVADYKSTTDASRTGFGKSSGEFGYAIQEAFYRHVLALLGIRVDRFPFICQEKTAPYLVAVHEHRPRDLVVPDRLVRKAIDIWTECRRTDEWPGYGIDTSPISLPQWAVRNWKALL